MTAVEPSADMVSIRQGLNERIKTVAGSDWCHRIELDESGQFVPAENLKFRLRILEQLFGSLFRNQIVLVLNERSGLYPVMIRRAGAAAVTANNASRDLCAVMGEVSSFTGESIEILNQSLALFDGERIFVDPDYAESHNFLFAQNVIWSLYNAADQSFADVVQACAHYVTDGLIFDWNDASWADPPPPKHYNRENFHAALRERFEYVLACNDWLTVALGKLPVEETVGRNGEVGAVADRPIESYQHLVRRIRAEVAHVVPPEATVVVVSKGDEALLRLPVRQAWHFPQSEDGRYAGHYPADSAAAIAHLEELRAQGGQYLLLPQPAFWWLEHYPEFAQHLTDHYRVVVRQEQICLLYALDQGQAAGEAVARW
jgi:hypothetical protein